MYLVHFWKQYLGTNCAWIHMCKKNSKHLILGFCRECHMAYKLHAIEFVK